MRYVTGWFPTSGLCEEDPNEDGWCAYHRAWHDEKRDDIYDTVAEARGVK